MRPAIFKKFVITVKGIPIRCKCVLNNDYIGRMKGLLSDKGLRSNLLPKRAFSMVIRSRDTQIKFRVDIPNEICGYLAVK